MRQASRRRAATAAMRVTYRPYAYREPFPLYFLHFYRNHIVWNRVSWFGF